jgi:hypothetical protein
MQFDELKKALDAWAAFLKTRQHSQRLLQAAGVG